jgi:transposase
MWTKVTRRKCEREEQRYASDVTDAEWALIEPLMSAAKPLGRPREVEPRAVFDAIFVYRADRLSVADAAEGLSSVHDGARLFLRLARQWPV